ncbi:hypothetical protein AUQ43_13430 [Thalassospira sp. MCCC 1A01148]|uniref:Uncharacterized protein n=1 Tax=Thalassospira profundimaris TaxID=502049 RepID=A0A367V761_9PROT|nr:hypothetical protein AUQ43_13430 [Thalassospira sp. MCCC 1A01148]RCK21027.1 hypothetical protein TH6_14710 [Thalassospira profundimaris]
MASGFAGAGVAVVVGAAADFDAALADTAAAFFGAAFLAGAFAAVVFFRAEDAADLLVAAVLLFVLTVLAFSFLVEVEGAVDLVVAGFAADAGRAAPDFATGDFWVGFAGLVWLGAGDDACILETDSGFVADVWPV